jgi:prepilin-type N-terminal cleavage/methylation domain-containing protein
MPINKKAFTLIELLVVVLIIGILAAIALPQYRKAVDKSKYTALISLTKGLADANEIYYLANGVYAEDFDKLDITPPAGGVCGDINGMDFITYDWGFCNLGQQNNVSCGNRTNINNNFQYYYSHGTSSIKGAVCIAYSTDVNDRYNAICRAFSGRQTPTLSAAGCRVPPNDAVSCNVYKM